MFKFLFERKWRIELRKRDKTQVEVRFVSATLGDIFLKATEECEELGDEWIVWEIRSL